MNCGKFIAPDRIVYFVLSYLDLTKERKRVYGEMNKEEFLETYEKAILYNESNIMNNEEYFGRLENLDFKVIEFLNIIIPEDVFWLIRDIKEDITKEEFLEQYREITKQYKEQIQ